MGAPIQDTVKIEHILKSAARDAGHAVAQSGIPIEATYNCRNVVSTERGAFVVQVILRPYTPPEDEEGRA